MTSLFVADVGCATSEVKSDLRNCVPDWRRYHQAVGIAKECKCDIEIFTRFHYKDQQSDLFRTKWRIETERGPWVKSAETSKCEKFARVRVVQVVNLVNKQSKQPCMDETLQLLLIKNLRGKEGTAYRINEKTTEECARLVCDSFEKAVGATLMVGNLGLTLRTLSKGVMKYLHELPPGDRIRGLRVLHHLQVGMSADNRLCAIYTNACRPLVLMRFVQGGDNAELSTDSFSGRQQS